MNPVIVFLAGGHSFFVGLLLMLCCAAFSSSTSRLSQLLASICLLLGVILIAVSVTPIAIWWYFLLVVSLLVWLLAVRFPLLRDSWKQTASRLLILSAISGFILEVPFYLPPLLSPPRQPRLVILADSLTAGLEETDVTWPERLAEEVDYEILDRSHVGAVVADGLTMLEGLELNGDLVLIELGGNDLLGPTQGTNFATSLKELLEQLREANCEIVMFEVPVPPFRFDIAYSQRSLCRMYDVDLIPKRYLLAAIAGETNTLDSIHLTAAGHQEMAEVMRGIFRPAFGR